MASSMQTSVVPKMKMNNGLEISAIALGTFLGIGKNGVPVLSENKQMRNVIKKAIEVGYRHVDTAAIYGTEAEIGEGIAAKITDGAVRREDLFVTTKLWNTDHARARVPEALRESLHKLGLDYVDLYLMHWPVALDSNSKLTDIDFMETYRGMEDALKLGLTKSIGLSNFNKQQVLRVLAECEVKPSVLQIEIHPQLIQKDLVDLAQSSGLIVMGFSPFGALVSRFGMDFPGPKVTDDKLIRIASKHNKTVPQIALAWLANRNIIPVPKTTKTHRLVENIDIFDVKLDAEDFSAIESYDSNTRYHLPSFWQESKNYPFEKIANPVDDVFSK